MCDIIKILPVELVLAKYRCPTEIVQRVLGRTFLAEAGTLRGEGAIGESLFVGTGDV